MKKFFAVLLVLAMVLSLAACGGNNNAPASEPSNTDGSANDANTPGDSNTGSFKYGFASWGTADEHGRTLNAAVGWEIGRAHV